MALRDLAGSGPCSRGPLGEAAAEEEGEAPLFVAAGATPEEDEEDDGRGRGLLRWDGFSAWLHCVCVVGFDLELGQAVEVRPGRTVAPPPFPGPPRLRGPGRGAGQRAWTPAVAHPGVAGRPSALATGVRSIGSSRGRILGCGEG